jgi:hypothetical protein
MLSRWVWIGVALLFACESIVEPRLDKVQELPVVDAWFTGESTRSYVKLSLTNDFENNAPFKPISQAQVWLKHLPSGKRFELKEKLASGIYLFDSLPIVQAGVYELQINHQNFVCMAQDQAALSLELDSMSFKFKFNMPTFENGYYATVHFFDPEKIKNFYMWELKVNSKTAFANQINLLEDELFDGKPVAFEIPLALKKSDTVEFMMLPLSRQSFRYYQGLRDLVNSGSPILATPNNPASNLSHGALGYFCVCLPSKKIAVVR